VFFDGDRRGQVRLNALDAPGRDVGWSVAVSPPTATQDAAAVIAAVGSALHSTPPFPVSTLAEGLG
jgi:hypothetical protein